jgi:Protein of unknown function (DUF1064)
MAKSVFTLDQLAKTPAAKLNQHLFVKPEKKNKRAKYKNEKIEWDGQIFDSKKEYRRYRELILLLKQGLISVPKRQVKYVLIEANEKERKCEYWADFVYISAIDGKEVVEDVKSSMTRRLPVYIMKRKLMKSKFNIEIKEV